HKPEGAVELSFLDTIVEHWQALIEARELKTRMFGTDFEASCLAPTRRSSRNSNGTSQDASGTSPAPFGICRLRNQPAVAPISPPAENRNPKLAPPQNALPPNTTSR